MLKKKRITFCLKNNVLYSCNVLYLSHLKSKLMKHIKKAVRRTDSFHGTKTKFTTIIIYIYCISINNVYLTKDTCLHSFKYLFFSFYSQNLTTSKWSWKSNVNQRHRPSVKYWSNRCLVLVNCDLPVLFPNTKHEINIFIPTWCSTHRRVIKICMSVEGFLLDFFLQVLPKTRNRQYIRLTHPIRPINFCAILQKPKPFWFPRFNWFIIVADPASHTHSYPPSYNNRRL